MSNLRTVKAALDAEIQHANEGIAFYAARIASLEQMIEQLDHLATGNGAKPPTKTAGKKRTGGRGANAARGAAVPAEKLKKSPGGASGRKSALPKTGGAFWQSLLSSTPMSNQELLTAAIAALHIRPAAADLKKLKQRLANAVTSMAKDGTMRSEGRGRARRFSSAG